MEASIDIKSELKQLIERESDTSILKAIRTLLTKSILDNDLKEKLANRALQSEEDIQEGNIFTKQAMK